MASICLGLNVLKKEMLERGYVVGSFVSSQITHYGTIVRYGDVIIGVMASQITSLKLFTQPFIQTQIKENIKAPLRVTGLCVGNSPGTGEFPAQMASNAENVSIWWRHHEIASVPGK